MATSLFDEALVQSITKRVIERVNSQPSARVARSSGSPPVPISISVRHIHLCREHLDILYGPGFDLEPRNPLYQPDTYAAKQTLTLVGPRMRCLGDVRVLGPMRKATQVEISRTDAIYLGVDPPVRPSGKLDGSAKLILVGPVGVVHLEQGVILANRHIHLHTTTASAYGISDNEYKSVRVATHKKTVFEDVQIRVSVEFKDEMHVDTDDGNACGVRGGEVAEIIV